MGADAHGRNRIKNTQSENRGNYFKVPNLVFQTDLSGGEILVYSYLLYCEDRATFTCYPSLKKIGAAVGMTKNTVAKYVRGLKEKGLIETERTTVITKKGEKRNGTLRYRIKPSSAVLAGFDERQMKKLIADDRKAEASAAIMKFDRSHGKK